ncbi:hypothetical protein LIT32_06650 [Bacillus sp. CMF21]|uniref:hypothetical protein n=1 Tax=Metabacillus dongyingensis TaxID=2874282 RepID=UPI001CBE4336|nr:hypothetical protein [Metabacillus dongyingensis]UAL53462.1 hypothetical protein K8L98_06645 [Metabacillus dongyingensis]USK29786.1 hypothetical protein LIT32_06650 [Bacillus sp. CMF21]
MRHFRYDVDNAENQNPDFEQRMLKLQSQSEMLERQIKARLEEVIKNLQDNTRFRYKLLDHPTQIIDIKNKLCQEFDGKAKEALDERLHNTYNLSYLTNGHYNIFINSFGMKQ